MKLSIVATLYHSASCLNEFYERCTAVAAQYAGEDYELILVNDGSPDNSIDIAADLSSQDKHLIVIDLSRNFGHYKAIMTGLNHAKGDEIFLIDSDLEESPELLISFAEKKNKEDCDVIYGVQAQRKGKSFERWSGLLFYKIFNMLSSVNIPESASTVRLMSRRYVDALLRHNESEIFIMGLWQITGYNQLPHVINKTSTSETTYTLRRKMILLVNAITSFSSAPLVGIFYIGCLIFLLSCIYTLYLVYRWSFFARPPTGWTSTITSVWLLGGAIISFLGIIGIYLSKIFYETKQRPNSIIRKIYRSDG